jgi:hypothetical protein
VVAVALEQMEAAGAELAVLNHSAAEVVRACDRLGMLSGPTTYFLFLSPGLQKRLGQAPAPGRSPWFTRGDGDGPIHLY